MHSSILKVMKKEKEKVSCQGTMYCSESFSAKHCPLQKENISFFFKVYMRIILTHSLHPIVIIEGGYQ